MRRRRIHCYQYRKRMTPKRDCGDVYVCVAAFRWCRCRMAERRPCGALADRAEAPDSGRRGVMIAQVGVGEREHAKGACVMRVLFFFFGRR